MNNLDFSLLEQIVVGDPGTWEKKRFLTLDIDWAHDSVLADAIDLVEKAGVQATWFVTHSTPLLDRLRANPAFRLGIHPNFNELLVGSTESGKESASRILRNLIDLVPEARAVRSHSLVQSERLVDLFHEHGLTHISNFFVPENAGPQRPWRLWSGMTCTPHIWQDNVSMRLDGSIRKPASELGLRIYDFHPIHVFLNTDRMEHYESARPFFQTPDELGKHRQLEAIGARDILLRLLGGEA